jgi:hypothetical protein
MKKLVASPQLMDKMLKTQEQGAASLHTEPQSHSIPTHPLLERLEAGVGTERVMSLSGREKEGA